MKCWTIAGKNLFWYHSHGINLNWFVVYVYWGGGISAARMLGKLAKARAKLKRVCSIGKNSTLVANTTGAALAIFKW